MKAFLIIVIFSAYSYQDENVTLSETTQSPEIPAEWRSPPEEALPNPARSPLEDPVPSSLEAPSLPNEQLNLRQLIQVPWLSKIWEQIGAVESGQSGLEQQVQELEETINQLVAALGTTTTTASPLEARVAALEATVAQLETEAADRDTLITQIGADATAALQAATLLNARVTALGGRATE